MNLEKAIKFPFKGDNWIKNLLIAAGLLLSGIGSFIVAGYGLEMIRDMAAKKSDDIELPEWTNFGENVMDGLKLIVVFLVWAIPIILVSIIFTVFIAILTNTATHNNIDIMNILIVIANIIFTFVTIVYSLGLYGFLPTIYGEVATKQTIKAGLNFSKIFKMNKGHFWKNVLTSLVASVVTSFIVPFGVIACFIGVFATAAISTAFTFHLYGQRYLDIIGTSPAVASPAADFAVE